MIKKIKGFTLIELLVVIAIIAMLSTIIIGPIQSARKKARDAKRSSELNSVKTALALYFDDNGSYPLSYSGSPAWKSECPAWGAYSNTNVIPGLVPNYLPKIPQDPLNVNPSSSSNYNCYLYISDGVTYKFMDYNMTESPLPTTSNFYNPTYPTNSWMICDGTQPCTGFY